MVRSYCKGLSDKEVRASEATYGTNALPPTRIESFWKKLGDNFDDPLIKILLLALGVTMLLAYAGHTQWLESFGIAFAVFLATFVSTYSEYKNESSFQRLQEEASRFRSKVFRNDCLASISISNIVKGDYILIQAGDKIPVDGRVVEGCLCVCQQSLTGEPCPVIKEVAPEGYKCQNPQFTDKYMVFRESVVNDGEAVIVADYVGVETQYGRLAKELSTTDERESPLQVKLVRLAENISTIGYVGAVLIACSFLFKQILMDQQYDMANVYEYLRNWKGVLGDCVTALILSIIIVVVAVPEGLPMMIAIVLSLNMRKLLKSKVLVRKLLGIEAAGSLNVLFVDKTGTLTEGKLEANLFVTGSLETYEALKKVPEALRKVVDFAIRYSTSARMGRDGELIGGNATDRAFLGFIRGSNETIPSQCLEHGREILFNSTHKFSLNEVRVRATDTALQYSLGPLINGGNLVEGKLEMSLVKGAPEIILPSCAYYYAADGEIRSLESHEGIRDYVRKVSARGVRVVALATSEKRLGADIKIPERMVLVGCFGIYDEVRPESKNAIRMVKQAGIQVVMITGDLEETAVSVAHQTGLLSPHGSRFGFDKRKVGELLEEDEPKNAIISSKDLEKMSDEQLMSSIQDLRVVSRAFPTDKSRLVRVAQRLNMVVGMTGDGVNDASALKASDVGFAMGSGTEVAKEASDIIIMDNNFSSIAMAILYGRTIFKSIRKFIVFQSTINMASTLIVFLGPFLGIDFPLTLIQLLWVNLVMDTLAAFAFGGEPALNAYMYEKPIQRDEPIVSPQMWSSILLNGTFIAGLSIFILSTPQISNLFVRDSVPSSAAFLTAFFSFFIFINVINALNVRTPTISLFDNLSSNTNFILVIGLIFFIQILFTYIGGQLLRTVPLTIYEWLLILFAAHTIIPFDIARKLLVPTFKQKPFSSRERFISLDESKLVKVLGEAPCLDDPEIRHYDKKTK
ncbi:uncharacterized protein LOC126318338 [Schistocerca gregaria]|uniref:uncharacterized protein LOC126318338 n=1 Tax=Schistocerca gregaria TaxID=7010 RepID=UPI00211E527A|nr:uncharacterized protein LOC126318338 [Schistocerca gregaria]